MTPVHETKIITINKRLFPYEKSRAKCYEWIEIRDKQYVNKLFGTHR